MHTDCEFEPLHKEMTTLGINLNCASKKEHVPEIERFIRTGQLILWNIFDYKKVCRLQPGEYVQVHQEDEPQHTINLNRTVGAIALGPQYNLQGGVIFWEPTNR